MLYGHQGQYLAPLNPLPFHPTDCPANLPLGSEDPSVSAEGCSLLQELERFFKEAPRSAAEFLVTCIR